MELVLFTCMNIIAQNNGDVNVYIAEENTDESISRTKWRIKKAHAQRIAAVLRSIGEISRSNRMSSCANYIVARECKDCGAIHVIGTKLCRDRMCPICNWRLSMRRFASMYTVLDGLITAYPESRWCFMTLTVKNCLPQQLSETLDEMSRMWNSIASSPKFKDRYAGWARSVEITYNKETRTLHPHYHIILMTHEGMKPNEYVIHRWLEGCKLTTNKAAQDIRDIRSKDIESDIPVSAILECYKYAIKTSELEDMPVSIFRETDKAIRHRRLVSYGGMIKDYAKLCEIKQLDNATEEDEEEAAALINKCVRCGSKQLVELTAEWSGTGYIWRSK